MATKKPMSSLALFVYLSCLVLSATSFPADKLSFDALYQFGDYTNHITRERPVGAHSPALTLNNPTLNCSSDENLMIEYIAKFFHLPLKSPYLNREGNFSHGVNFAVAGATALNTSVLAAKGVLSPVTNSSLSVQLNWFSLTLTLYAKMQLCKKKVSKSLILIGEVGEIDYNYALVEGKSMKELHIMVPEVVETVKAAVKEVVNLGATRVVVPGTFPISCTAFNLTTAFEVKDPITSMYDKDKCSTNLKNVAEFHNDLLEQAIKEIQEEHPTVAIVYGDDYFNGLRWILRSVPLLRFEPNEFQQLCCGNSTYDYNSNQMCGAEGIRVCSNPSERFESSIIDTTQGTYLYIAQWLLDKHIIPSILQVV